MYPVYAYLPSLDLTPHVAYLKLAQLNNPDRKESFLLESAKTSNELDRYSFIGISPRKIIKTGPTEGVETDPLEFWKKRSPHSKWQKTSPVYPN